MIDTPAEEGSRNDFFAMESAHAGVAQARERKMKAQEALRISELEISLCKWQRRLHEMERRLQSCEETEVASTTPCTHARLPNHH